MQEHFIQNAKDFVGETVTLKGWAYNVRKGGKIWFLLLRDGTGIMQCVVTKFDADEASFDIKTMITQESSVIVTGEVKEEPRSPGGYEMLVQSMELVAVADEYPISKKEHGTDYLMDNRHLWLRSKRQHAIIRIRHTIVKAIRDYFDDRDFTLVDTPIFQKAATEGTSTLFETEYFGEKAFLTQSGQLYGEAGAAAFGKIYCFGPTFRAEKSKTRRHLTEFWMVEPEMAYYDLDMNMDVAEDFVSYIVSQVLEHRRAELETLERDISKLEAIQKPFPRISYTDAVKILNDNGVEFKWGDDFGGGDETIISSQFDSPVMVHRYPSAIKAFYMKRDPENDKQAMALDMLAPEGYGEIIGGSQREDDIEALVGRIKEDGATEEDYSWYLDLRRYGSFPHSGFGLGVERVVSWLCGLQHIRETIPFPRTISRLNP
ncbi:MAG: asparagine--tRNA ligase [Candidatus Marinimicrobia bacterium]|nr:asparagine--tRNA ligase [Candidatus Neomarinimicrobiota bacterium]MBT3574927.1 asparagine--tRNA ligase [Candidatus Neomarinimicrobiota bacterium]MBT3679690.1 asparagine--tRNA ligase [Candidatus Neomarinimicrobiota bacterium]MBT3950793.1 asparagine--tRNA ligase [Candidatus Neomarinimicrobiota bacterium]MBT4252384.1 asparagine--tRNA ligase [Candidatus Neomarinimicrobiota bacterium]